MIGAETCRLRRSRRLIAYRVVSSVRQIRIGYENRNCSVAAPRNHVGEAPSFKDARMSFEKLDFAAFFAGVFFAENFPDGRNHRLVQIFIKFPVFFGGFLQCYRIFFKAEMQSAIFVVAEGFARQLPPRGSNDFRLTLFFGRARIFKRLIRLTLPGDIIFGRGRRMPQPICAEQRAEQQASRSGRR